MVVYPEGIWYRVRGTDVKEIMERHIMKEKWSTDC